MVANLAPRKMKFGVSEGMVLAASGDGPAYLPACAGRGRAAGHARQMIDVMSKRLAQADVIPPVPDGRRDYLTQHGVAYAQRHAAASTLGPRRAAPALKRVRRAERCVNGFAGRAGCIWTAAARRRAAGCGRLPGRRAAPLRLVVARAVSARRRGRPGARRRRARRVFAPPEVAVLPLGLPDLPFHLRLDALSAFFLFLLGARGGRRSRLFAAGYFRAARARRPGCCASSTTCSSPHGAGAARRRRLRVHGRRGRRWRCRRSSSSPTNHRIPEIRRAGFLYLLIAHVGAIAHPAVLRRAAGRHRRLHLRHHARAARCRRSGPRSPSCSRCSASAPRPGSLPLHVWLPEAHPAAPSPVSALMSGVMLKTAIYGLLRVTFDLLHAQLWWWGVVAAGARPRHRAVRRGLRRGADRHEAAARLFVDREHRHHRRRHRPGDRSSRPTA